MVTYMFGIQVLQLGSMLVQLLDHKVRRVRKGHKVQLVLKVHKVELVRRVRRVHKDQKVHRDRRVSLAQELMM
jgi:hypothetical protein